MSQAHPSPDDADFRLGEAIDGYLALCQRGEQVSIDQWAARFPDIAEEVRECLEAIPLLQRQSGSKPPQDRSAVPRGPSAPEVVAGRPDDENDLRWPQVCGYTLLEELGRGGMGIVYRAEQQGTRRTVALKLLVGGPFASPAAHRRFTREVELAAALDHDGIVRVFEAGESSDGLYFAMEYVQGRPLHAFLAEENLDVARKLALFLKIVELSLIHI